MLEMEKLLQDFSEFSPFLEEIGSQDEYFFKAYKIN
jgi:hypothetical protein